MTKWNKHDKDEYLKAKEAEIQRLIDIDVYIDIDNVGQTCIFTKWMLTRKEGQVKAHVVMRGFEEIEMAEGFSP